jgi:hypothetical protein
MYAVVGISHGGLWALAGKVNIGKARIIRRIAVIAVDNFSFFIFSVFIFFLQNCISEAYANKILQPQGVAIKLKFRTHYTRRAASRSR